MVDHLLGLMGLSSFSLLDRFLASMDWDRLYPNCVVKDLAKNGSDHCPLILCTSMPRLQVHHRFRFEKEWLLNDDFNALVIKWGQEIELSGEIGEAWKNKIAKMRKKKRGWYKNYIGEKHRKRKQLLQILHAFEVVMESRDLNKEEFDAWQVSKKELDDIYFTDELYWQQRARDQWLKEGDNNKTFFHKSATIRKKANLILSMEIDGSISDSLPEIRNHILYFYKNLFAVEHIKKINFEAG